MKQPILRLELSRHGRQTNVVLDPPRCRAPEGRRCPPPLHEAAHDQEPLLPSAPPRQQLRHEEDLPRQASFHVRLRSVFWGTVFLHCSREKFGQVLRVFTRSHGTTTCIGPLGNGANESNKEMTHSLDCTRALHGCESRHLTMACATGGLDSPNESRRQVGSIGTGSTKRNWTIVAFGLSFWTEDESMRQTFVVFRKCV